MRREIDASQRRIAAVLEPAEKEVQAAVLDHWRAAGIPGSLVAAIPNAGALGQPGLTAGLPDLLVMSPKLGARTLFMELKREGRRYERFGGLSSDQREFKLLCESLRIPHLIAYGRDDPIAMLRAWGAIR